MNHFAGCLHGQPLRIPGCSARRFSGLICQDLVPGEWGPTVKRGYDGDLWISHDLWITAEQIWIKMVVICRYARQILPEPAFYWGKSRQFEWVAPFVHELTWETQSEMTLAGHPMIVYSGSPETQELWFAIGFTTAAIAMIK